MTTTKKPTTKPTTKPSLTPTPKKVAPKKLEAVSKEGVAPVAAPPVAEMAAPGVPPVVRDTVAVLREVASFAAEGSAGLFDIWKAINFRPGEVFAQDGSLGAWSKVDLDLSGSVEAGKLLKAIKAVGEDPSFTMDKGSLVLRSGDVRVQLPVLSSDLTPKFHTPPADGWEATTLFSAVSKIGWCVGKERAHISGVNITAGEIQVTNGHVGIVYRDEARGGFRGFGDPVLVDPSVFSGLPPLVSVRVHEDRFFVANEARTLFRSAKLISAQFPSLEHVMGGCASIPSGGRVSGCASGRGGARCGGWHAGVAEVREGSVVGDGRRQGGQGSVCVLR